MSIDKYITEIMAIDKVYTGNRDNVYYDNYVDIV